MGETGELWDGTLGHFFFLSKICFDYPPRNLTKIPKLAIFKGNHLFQTILLGIHVSFRGYISFDSGEL